MTPKRNYSFEAEYIGFAKQIHERGNLECQKVMSKKYFLEQLLQKGSFRITTT